MYSTWKQWVDRAFLQSYCFNDIENKEEKEDDRNNIQNNWIMKFNTKII